MRSGFSIATASAFGLLSCMLCGIQSLVLSWRTLSRTSVSMMERIFNWQLHTVDRPFWLRGPSIGAKMKANWFLKRGKQKFKEMMLIWGRRANLTFLHDVTQGPNYVILVRNDSNETPNLEICPQITRTGDESSPNICNPMFKQRQRGGGLSEKKVWGKDPRTREVEDQWIATFDCFK